MSNNYYFNVSLDSRTFSIYETTKKSKKRHNAIETLKKIEKALKENLKCSSTSAQDIQIKKAEAFRLLQAKATAIRNGYDQKQSKLCWLWRKIFSKKKQVDAVHKRIAGLTLRTKNALPILHDDAINEVLNFLPIDDLKRFREVNAHAKAHADLALKDAARKLGYKGKKIGKAKRYLKILSHNLHTLSQQDWKYGVNGNSLFKNLIVYVNGKISIEESLNHLKQLSIDDLVKLFAQDVPLQHLKKAILTPPISRGETFTDLQSANLALYIAVRNRELEVAQFLLMHGANAKSKKLLSLSIKQKTTLMTHLLLQAKANIAPRLLHEAAQIPNNQKNISLLLRYGAIASPVCRENEPAIFEAVKSKNLANVRALIKGGSDLNYAVTVWISRDEDMNFQEEDGNTVLHIAVWHGTPEIIKLLVQRGADPYKWDTDESTPIKKAIRIAIREKNVSKVLAFIEGGMNLNHSDKKGQTPLHIAVQDGTPEIIKLLVQRGADPSISNKDRQTPLHLAVWNGTPEIIKLLVQRGADPYKCSRYERPPIEIAITKRSVPKVLAFIEGGMDLNHSDKDGRTLLHLAVWDSTPEIIKLLVQRGADPCIADKDGQTPLHVATEGGYWESIKLLIQHGDINLNHSNKDGQTALHLAAEYGNSKSIKLLIQHGADPSVLDNQGYSPLMFAIKSFRSKSVFAFLEEKLYSPEEGQAALRFALNCNIPIMLNLLLQHKIDLTYTDKDGQTALHIAAKYHRPEIIKLLLQHGTDPYQCDNLGKTPFFVAIENGHFDNVKAFLEPGIDLSYTNQAGQTALHIAADTSGPYDITPKTIELLIKHGADLYQCDNSGKIPLFVAIENQNPGNVQAFIEGGMDLNYTSLNRITALHIAAKTEYGSPRIIKSLIRHGADPYQCDPLGNPPFFNAIKYHRLAKGFYSKKAIITAFIKSGIDLNYTNKDGKTALHIAAEYGTPGIVELLIKHGANPNIKDNDGLTPLDLLLADESDNSMSTEG